jgi:hypothetical protein
VGSTHQIFQSLGGDTNPQGHVQGLPTQPPSYKEFSRDKILLLGDFNEDVYLGSSLAVDLSREEYRMSELCLYTTGIQLPSTIPMVIFPSMPSMQPPILCAQ